MNLRRPSSFWRYNLQAELVAASLAGVVLLSGSGILLRQLQQRYLELHRADGERVVLYLKAHLEKGVEELERFADLPAAQRNGSSALLPASFSDLYLIDAGKRVRHIHKAGPDSRVFEGFSFVGSRIQPYLRESTGPNGTATPGMSRVSRGHEDELASIYVKRALNESQGERWLLGRINLRYIQEFLSTFSRFTNTPVLLVSQDGFVMLTGENRPQVPAIDLTPGETRAGFLAPLTLEGQQWLPLVSADTGLGAHIVTLVPLQRLREQERLVLLITAAACALIGLVFVLKNLRLRQRLFAPVGRFVEQVQRLEAQYRMPPAGVAPATAGLDAGPLALPGREFEEIQRIQACVEALMRAVEQRDECLREQLRTSLTAATIAHEINLPLSTIRLLCQRAQQQVALEGCALDVEELVGTLGQQSEQVSRVIEKMRMLLRNVPTEHSPIDLALVVRGASILVDHRVLEHQVRLESDGLSEGAWIVQGDAAQLQIAISNVLLNAIEAVASQPQERRSVQLGIQRRGAEVALRIADSGPGFSFDPVGETLFRTTKASGSGLGLFVARTTVNHHHGRILIDRCHTLGGAVVTLWLPLLQEGNA